LGEVIFTAKMGAIAGNQMRLYTSASSPTPIATSAFEPYALSTGNLGLGSTTFYISAYNTTGQCESDRLPVVAVVSTGVVAPQSVSSRQVGCEFGSVTFTVTLGNPTASLLSGDGVRLYAEPTGGSPIATDIEGPFTLNTPNIGFTRVYYIASFDRASGCESERVPAMATVLSTVPSTPNAKADAICSSTATSVQISVTQGEIIGREVRLYTRAFGGTPVSTTSTEPYVLVSPSINQTTTFFVAAGSGACESVRRQVVVAVNPFPSAPSVTASSSCDGSVVTISASLTNNIAGAEIRVYAGPNDVTPVAVSSSAPYEITLAASNTGTYYVSSAVGGACESPRRAVTVNRTSAITATATVTAVSCRSLGGVTAFATGAGPFQYRLFNATTGMLAMMNSSGIFPNVEQGRYYVEVSNSLGCKGRTVEFEVQGPEGPRGVSVSNITQSTATVTWTMNDPDIIDFEVRYRLAGNNNYQSVIRVPASASSLNLSNLQAGANYEVEVRGICNSGRPTEWASSTFTTTRSGGEGICATPTNIRVTPTSANTATVSWTPNIAGAFCYIVSYGPTGTRPDLWPQFLVTHPLSSLNLMNLSAGVSYSVQVRTNCSECSLRSGFMTEPSAPVIFSTSANRQEAIGVGLDLRVYPNPSDGRFNITFNAPVAEKVNLTIMDLTGRKAFESDFEAVVGDNEIPVDLSGVGSGVYLVKFRQGAVTAITKVSMR
jgi:hypothetical protein